MTQIKVTDEWLYQHMPIADEAIIQKLEKETDYEYKFSDKFEQGMDKIIKREAYPLRSLFVSKFKSAAIFAVCTVSVLFLLSMSVEAHRVKFFETMKTLLNDSILYKFVVSEEEKIDTIQITEPSYIPEEYMETKRIENAININIFYENAVGEQIIWEQILVRDGSSVVLDTEYDAQETREIAGSTATIYLYSDGYAMAYYEHSQYMYLITADKLQSEELFKMIASMNNLF